MIALGFGLGVWTLMYCVEHGELLLGIIGLAVFMFGGARLESA